MKLTRLLALLLAALMVCTAFAACSTGDGGDDNEREEEEEDDDEGGSKKDPFVKYKRLKPHQIADAIRGASEISYTSIATVYEDGEEVVETREYLRDGDLACYRADFDGDELVIVKNLKTGKYRSENMADEYAQSLNWEEMCLSMLGLSDRFFMFYVSEDEYEGEGNTFTLTQTVIAEALELNEWDGELSGKIHRDGTKYTYTASLRNDSGQPDYDLTVTVEFVDVTLTMDEVTGETVGEVTGTPEQGGNDAEESTGTSNQPTPKPEEPEEERPLSPAGLALALVTLDYADITVRYSGSDNNLRLQLRKEGSKAELIERTSEGVATVYYDFANERILFAENYQWYFRYSDNLTFNDVLVYFDKTFACGMLLPDESEYTYDADRRVYCWENNPSSSGFVEWIEMRTVRAGLFEYLLKVADSDLEVLLEVDLASTYSITLPEAIEKVEQPEVTYLSPSELYNYMISQERVTVDFTTAAGATVKIVRSGAIISVLQPDGNGSPVQLYLNVETGQMLRQNATSGEWEWIDSAYTMEGVLGEFGLSRNNDIFKDASYAAFGPSDAQLAFSNNSDTQSVLLQRAQGVYTFNGHNAAGDDVITVTLTAQDIQLPTVGAPENPENPDTPIYLSPSELFYAMTSSERVTVTLEAGGPTMTFVRYGNLIRATREDVTIYMDEGTGISYRLGEDGVWQTSNEGYTWLAVLEEFGLSGENALFENASYAPFTVTDAVIRFASGSDVTMTRGELTYEIRIVDGESVNTMTVTFAAEAIELPSVEAPEQGTEDGMYLSPSELCYAMLSQEHVTVTLNEIGTVTRFVRDGHLYLVTQGNRTVYVDEATGRNYLPDHNGIWQSDDDAMGWEALLNEYGISAENTLFQNASYAPFTVTDSVIRFADGSDITWTRSELTYTLRMVSDELVTTLEVSFGQTEVVLPEVGTSAS